MENRQVIFEQLKKLRPQAIVLFGSTSRGEAGKDSDMDILLIKQTNKPFSDRVREARSMVRTRRPLDIIVITPQEAKELPKKNSFFSQVLNEGKLVYGRI